MTRLYFKWAFHVLHMKHAKAETKRKKNKQLRVGRFILQHTNINPHAPIRYTYQN